MKASGAGRGGSPARGGFLVLLKPPGMTSHDAVQFVRRVFRTRDVGHAGTLDPAAAGVLVVAVGRALKLLEFLGDAGKEYYGEVLFGRSTSTGDAEGDTTDEGDASGLPAPEVRRAMEGMVGSIQQVPPSFSAIKVAGRPVYEKARRGEAVVLPARTVRIDRFELLDWFEGTPGRPAAATPRARFRVSCGKGTYVRALATDLGRAVGVPAHLGFLLRVSVGPFKLEQALALEEVEAAAAVGEAEALLQPLVAAIPGWARARLTSAGMEYVWHGRPVSMDRGEGGQAAWEAGGGTGRAAPDGALVALLDPGGDLAAVGRWDADAGLLKPTKVMALGRLS